MNVGTVDIMDALSPSSGGAIARAMQELESKLSAWMNAAESVNDGFASKEAAQSEALSCAATAPPGDQRVNAPVANVVTPEKPLPTETIEKSTNVEIHDSGPSEKDAIGVPSESIESTDSPLKAPQADAAVANEPETPAVVEALLAELNPETAEAVRARYDYFKGRKAIRDLIQEFEDEADDEESLLMSLDPEMAKAVRVKYRLYNGRKTVREVIAEVEAQLKAPQQAEKKNWWGKKR